MASIKITLSDSEFSELRERAGRAGIPFSVFAKLCYSAGIVVPYKVFDGVKPQSKGMKVTRAVNLKNARKTRKRSGKNGK